MVYVFIFFYLVFFLNLLLLPISQKIIKDQKKKILFTYFCLYGVRIIIMSSDFFPLYPKFYFILIVFQQ